VKCCKKFNCLSAGIYVDESGMMQYYADDCYACDVYFKEEAVLVLNVIFSTVRSTTFEMPFLHLLTN